MSDYRILLPVMGSPELVSDVLSHIEYQDKLILVNNFDDLDVMQICRETRDQGAQLFYHPENLGLAASWNLGFKIAMEAGCDFCIFLSASVQLNQNIEEFVDRLYKTDLSEARYITNGLTTLHCFAHTRVAYDRMKFWDENFYPIYLEDSDWCWRAKLYNDLEPGAVIAVNFQMNDFSVSRNFSHSSNSQPRVARQVRDNMPRMGEYYQRKWGGGAGIEAYKFPFNNCEWELHRWELEESGRIMMRPRDDIQPFPL